VSEDEWVELTGDDIPAHLRDDAPTQRCGRCLRCTWDEAQFGQECRMPQPDGFPCGGTFGGLPEDPKPTTRRHQ
jgi:hypothetical protein